MENKVKKRYSAPTVEVLEFGSEDIITTSGFFGAEDEFIVGGANVEGSYSNELPADYGNGQ